MRAVLGPGRATAKSAYAEASTRDVVKATGVAPSVTVVAADPRDASDAAARRSEHHADAMRLPEAVLTGNSDSDLDDPMGGPSRAYRRTADRIDELVARGHVEPVRGHARDAADLRRLPR